MEDLDDEEALARKESGLTVTQELDNMMEQARIDGDLIESLGSGLRKFGDAAGKLNETVDAAAATSDYSGQLTLAAKNMESLNALYAVQLESSANQMELQNSLMEKLNGAMGESEKLNSEVINLVSNMTSLNNVYGGMLSAMNANKG
jgi:gliding motility-associated protein GldL